MNGHWNADRRRFAIAATALCLGGVFSPAARAADDAGWDWKVVPYLWAVSFDTDLERTAPPEGGISNDTTFDDVLEKFDGVFQIHIEGQNDAWGMFTDFTYLGLADDAEYPRFRTESDLDARLYELAVVWSPGEQRYRGVEVFGGLRYIDMDLTIRFAPVDPMFGASTWEGGDSYSDFMVGARYAWTLSDHWGMTLRGDGSFGDTEGTWNVSVVAGYQRNNGAWVFGYRYLSVDVDTGDADVELTASGPMIGYAFDF